MRDLLFGGDDDDKQPVEEWVGQFEEQRRWWHWYHLKPFIVVALGLGTGWLLVSGLSAFLTVLGTFCTCIFASISRDYRW